jgi:superfamily II RNA helicase
MEYRGLTLDKFQEDSVKAIDDNRSVLVSAPTGCGKTIIAEYAVDVSMEKGKRVIYTAPIKALSNQKYRDFKQRFGEENVGIHTGDVSLNPTAPILIMTTEIFRNMILEQSERLTEVLYTVFDEVHFIDDEDRGTVWEESIILAPEHIRFVCLSATVPNIDVIADWMQSVRGSEFTVVKESVRPVPLKNHLFSAKYGPVSFDLLANKYIKNAKQRKKFMFRKPSSRRIIKTVLRNEGTPVLYFAFNRKACERNAHHHAGLSLLNSEEQGRIDEMVTSLVQQYQVEDYEKLDSMVSIWKRGVAYHHAGILPAAKEIIERLFSTGLIKLLFCTETFALGVNMPARTVIFDELEKYNGVEYLYLTNRAFQQMAGRAGRRGMDTMGHVYCHIIPEATNPKEVKRLFYEGSEEVRSRFYASYATILSLYSRYGEESYPIFRKSLRNYSQSGFHISKSYQKEEDKIRTKVKFLQYNGFLEGQTLTKKGELALCVNGYEIQAAELYFSRSFDSLSPEYICVILGALITEQRKKNQPVSDFKITFEGEKVIKQLRQKESKAGIKDLVRELDFSMAAPIMSWVNGGDLRELGSFGIPEGDIIRIFRMIVQLIRTIKANIDDPVTIEKFKIAMDLINRGAVDAEAELKIESSL